MSRSFNRVLLLGNVGKDPEVYNPRSGMVARLTLATDEMEPDGRGGWIKRTEWHDLVARGKSAQIIRDYVRKGATIFIEGKNQTGSWPDRETQEMRYRKEVLVVFVSLLSGGSASEVEGQSSRGDSENFVPFGAYVGLPELTQDEVPY